MAHGEAKESNALTVIGWPPMLFASYITGHAASGV